MGHAGAVRTTITLLAAVALAILAASLLSLAGPASRGPTDLASSIPTQNKATVVVIHPDCRFENFLLPPEQVAAFIQSLPAGDRVTVVVEPQGSSTEKSAPRATVYPGVEPSDCQTRTARNSGPPESRLTPLPSPTLGMEAAVRAYVQAEFTTRTSLGPRMEQEPPSTMDRVDCLAGDALRRRLREVGQAGTDHEGTRCVVVLHGRFRFGGVAGGPPSAWCGSALLVLDPDTHRLDTVGVCGSN